MNLTLRRKTNAASRACFLGSATKGTTVKDSGAGVQFQLLSPAEVQLGKLLNDPSQPLYPILRAKQQNGKFQIR